MEENNFKVKIRKEIGEIIFSFIFILLANYIREK